MLPGFERPLRPRGRFRRGGSCCLRCLAKWRCGALQSRVRPSNREGDLHGRRTDVHLGGPGVEPGADHAPGPPYPGGRTGDPGRPLRAPDGCGRDARCFAARHRNRGGEHGDRSWNAWSRRSLPRHGRREIFRQEYRGDELRPYGIPAHCLGPCPPAEQSDVWVCDRGGCPHLPRDRYSVREVRWDGERHEECTGRLGTRRPRADDDGEGERDCRANDGKDNGDP